MEIWRDIPGYEGRYQASTLGRIRSLDRRVPVYDSTGRFTRAVRGRILRPGKCRSGHVSVVLGNGKPGSMVHQLICRTFIGPCPKGMEVLHKNGNPCDNRLENLHYGTRTENILDVYKVGKRWRKFSLNDVDRIRFELFCGIPGHEIAKEYAASDATISAIKRGRTYRWYQ